VSRFGVLGCVGISLGSPISEHPDTKEKGRQKDSQAKQWGQISAALEWPLCPGMRC